MERDHRPNRGALRTPSLSLASRDITPDRPTSWHLITGEYPPDHGGVSDYTRLVAERLCSESGEERCDVHVWCRGREAQPVPVHVGPTIHRSAGDFGLADLRRLSKSLNEISGRRILFVQYVPQAFGARGMNLPFCLWLVGRRTQGDDVRVLFHEVAFPFVRRPLKWNILAVVQRAMAATVLRAASTVYVSTAAWIPFLKRLGLGSRRAETLPIPSNFPTTVAPAAIAEARRRTMPGGAASDGAPIVGHFGTYGSSITVLLTPILLRLLNEIPELVVALIGRGSVAYRGELATISPEHARRIVPFDDLQPDAITAHILAADFMLQPYPDGASSRRTSLMACLATSAPTITTFGELSEPMWQTQQACAAVAVGDIDGIVAIARSWLADPELRRAVGRTGGSYYQAHFSLDRTIHLILERPPTEPHVASQR